MDIAQLARKPQLLEITIDDEGIVEEYGDTIKFWMYDFVDINTYFDFFKAQTTEGQSQMNEMLRSIIKKSDGTAVLAEGESLPVDIAVAALTRINETLGKSKPKSLTLKTGNQPK